MAVESPVVLVKWYDVVKWFLERVDSFPKNQRFVFGQRLADRAIDVLELLVEAAYSPRKADLGPGQPRHRGLAVAGAAGEGPRPVHDAAIWFRLQGLDGMWADGRRLAQAGRRQGVRRCVGRVRGRSTSSTVRISSRSDGAMVAVGFNPRFATPQNPPLSRSDN